MAEAEKPECAHLADDVTAYAWGGRGDELRARVEPHLKKCASCKRFVGFVKDFVAAARGRTLPGVPPGPHPDASLIVDLEADKLDEQKAREVGLHLLDCAPCREAYLRLRGLTRLGVEEALFPEVKHSIPGRKNLNFSDLELRILELWARGRTDEEIGYEVSLTEQAVRDHLTSIFIRTSETESSPSWTIVAVRPRRSRPKPRSRRR